MYSTLKRTLEKGLEERRASGIPHNAEKIHLPATVDFANNDYLSLSSNPTLRRGYLKALETSPFLFGARGTRVGGGTNLEHLALEAYFRQVFNAQAAILVNSGFTANIAFTGTIPQMGDVLLYDSLVHASLIDGMRMSRARHSMIPFEHNCMQSLEGHLKKIIEENQLITSGKATLFVILESAYSMDGDFCPLVELVNLVEKYIPPEAVHIVVDEARTIGLYGPQGKGLIHLWGRQDPVILTSTTILDFMETFARPYVYGTALPFVDLIAIKQCFNLVMGPVGDMQRQKLHENTRFFARLLQESFTDIPTTLLLWPNQSIQIPSKEDVTAQPVLISPIFPILSSKVVSLEEYLCKHGHRVLAVAFPVVPRGSERLRVTIHAGNSQKEMWDFVWLIRNWALREMEIMASGTNHVKAEESESRIIYKL
ncbi:aminotransferase [Hysterangium stoloniferum]|nr:aminotransferase [Hysterangium stoloniferum]